ncbi:sigma-54 dependent transcriptional regulator [Flavitalea sp. BT771]|uniref:sigma-54-dependent transcriptional regulator n=1 Tax=Flavitalea sp. BT771 TaxID=3063329 RepID=UPI0026E3E8F4|nr:sigma-54 dependent transcriptional regulator [Flavitalea sp. BT771]MDO6430229.1 sigma-54 dependent transcriptional regulator [Flavitalea sp. BT771]MDV6219631.1 sigma-54 dependent transcriptional regulator [Flavitalea sp. BT771]
METRILIVEDEFIIASSLKIILEQAGNSVTGIASSVTKALQMIDNECPDWVFLDIYLVGQETGVDLANILNARNIPFIYVSANSNHSVLMEARTTRPLGFLVKPFREQDVLVTLEVAKYRHEHDIKMQLHRETVLKEPVITDVDFVDHGMIGRAPLFQKVKEQIATVAPFDVSVLLLGESGTGKERVAHAIHVRSERRAKPLVRINCSAIPETLIEAELFGFEKGAFTGATDRRIGKFEQADGGTIFLDEIGEIPLELQVKLLNVLQEKEVVRIGSNKVIKTDVRIIAATNRNLERAIAAGSFRLDLYYRLNVFPITMPALRERKEDIPLLVDHFIRMLSVKMHKTPKRISHAALQSLQGYTWPGNIRELENIIERCLITNKGEIIESIEIPSTEILNVVSPNLGKAIKTIREAEKEHILAALEFCKGRISGIDGAAKLLDISPTTLAARLKKFGIAKDILDE